MEEKRKKLLPEKCPVCSDGEFIDRESYVWCAKTNCCTAYDSIYMAGKVMAAEGKFWWLAKPLEFIWAELSVEELLRIVKLQSFR